MNKILTAFVLAASILPPFAAAAEETPSALPTPRGGSVYRINPAIDFPVLGAAALGAIVPLFIEPQLIHRKCPCDPNDVNSFDRPVIGNHDETIGKISHFTVALAVAAPLVLDGADQGFNKAFAEDLMVYVEVLSLNTSLSHIARYGAQRPRPVAYEVSPPEIRAGEFLSFYSGHNASVFAALSAASMTYGYRYGHKAWPWAVTAVLGLGESAMRVAAGRHFYTDVIMGAAMGTAVGTLVPYLHRRYRKSSLTLAPTPDGSGAQLVWRKRF
ncbi:MAG: hypothetical protein A3A86_06910 [Elusimicrobia bacterium RIFCSPLOWO2_01_FULL_60_11]|nr:MAG: hypothetical protein A3A86_06910 [Elusimicrobia bacterium RIFCSPLOWO2_01_FULL_60_11]